MLAAMTTGARGNWRYFVFGLVLMWGLARRNRQALDKSRRARESGNPNLALESLNDLHALLVPYVASLLGFFVSLVLIEVVVILIFKAFVF